MVWFLIIALLVIIDQLTKYLIIKNIEYGDSITMIDRFFYIVHWKNKGAAWGIMQNWRIFFIIATIIVSAVLIYYMFKSDNKFLRFAISLVLGGAFGNFADRVFRGGEVVDFLDFYIGSYHFPTFNAADSFICIGTALLAIYMFFIYKEKEKEIEVDQQEE